MSLYRDMHLEEDKWPRHLEAAVGWCFFKSKNTQAGHQPPCLEQILPPSPWKEPDSSFCKSWTFSFRNARQISSWRTTQPEALSDDSHSIPKQSQGFVNGQHPPIFHSILQPSVDRTVTETTPSSWLLWGVYLERRSLALAAKAK